MREMADDHLGKADFLKAFEDVLKRVQSMDERLSDDAAALADTLTSNVEELRNSSTIDLESFKAEVLALLSGELASLVSKVDERLSAVRNGNDADPAQVADLVLSQIQLPDIKEQIVDTPLDVRNKLDLLPAEEDPKAIIELREEIEKLKKDIKGKSSVAGGGSMGLSVGHWPLHEAFTMDGVATTVTLTQGGVGANGNAVLVRYQGQMLDMTTQFTVNGNTITLVGFTPESGTIISVTYWL